MPNLLVAGNSTNGGTAITTDTSGTLNIVTGSGSGTTAITVDGSQAVGIGTTSPAAKLDISGSTSVANRSLRMLPTTEADIVANVRTSTIQRITTDSVLAMGYATTPDAWYISASYGGTGAYKPLAFATSDTERMRIDSSGNLIIAKTTTAATTAGTYFSASDFGALAVSQATGNRAAIFSNTSGTGTGNITINASTTSYNTSSDYRLKENIQPMTGALAKVSALKPVTYKWKADGSNGEGFIAHELQAVVPDCVTGEKDAVDDDGNPKYQGVDTSFLVATLTAAIQELKAELDAVKAKVGA